MVTLNKSKYWILAGIFIFIFVGILFIQNEVSFYYRFNSAVKYPFLDYCYGLLSAIFFTLIILVFPFRFKRILFAGWVFRLFIVFIFDLYYEIHYSSLDSPGYFFHAIYNPVYNFIPAKGSYNVIALLSYMVNFCPSYKLCVVIFSFIGLMAVYLFWYWLSKMSGSENKLFLLLCMFYPSLAFWGHGIGKDTLILFFTSTYFGALCCLYRRKIIEALFLLLFSLAGFLFFRIWLIFIMFLSLYLSIIYLGIISNKSKLFKIVLSILCGLAIYLTYFVLFKHSDIYLTFIKGFVLDGAQGNSGQRIFIRSFREYVFNLPWVLFTTLFRPLFFESKNIFQFLSGIENTILLIFFSFSLVRFLMKMMLKNYIAVISLIHIIVWTLIYGPISCQNLGNAVRFKVQIMPFILIFIIYAGSGEYISRIYYYVYSLLKKYRHKNVLFG